DYINVLRVEPVAGPRVHESERIAPVLEAVIAVLGSADKKRVLLSKIGLEFVRGNAATIVTSGALFRLRAFFRRLDVLFLLLCVLLFRLGVLLLLRRGFFLLLSGLLRLRFFLFLGRLGFLFVL